MELIIVLALIGIVLTVAGSMFVVGISPLILQMNRWKAIPVEEWHF